MWYVFKARAGDDKGYHQAPELLAWCLLSPDGGHGFDTVFYTQLDGVTPADQAEGTPLPLLESLLFTARRPLSP